MKINLASQSPARLELLRKAGFEVEPFPQDINETTSQTEPGKVVEDLALQKLDAFMKSSDFKADEISLASDTLIYFNGRLIGKARSNGEAKNQIASFAGHTHKVYSGYALFYKGTLYHGFDCTDVSFREIPEEELEKYIDSMEWKGAAGSYHIQGLAETFISEVKGDINTVIGLPLNKVLEIIRI